MKKWFPLPTIVQINAEKNKNNFKDNFDFFCFLSSTYEKLDSRICNFASIFFITLTVFEILMQALELY